MQALTLSLLLLGAPATAPATQPVLATSKHYEIRGDVDARWAAEMGRMLDQAHERLRELLGKTPPADKRFVINLFGNPRQRDSAVGGKLEAGGLFAYEDRQCYLSLQPTNYYTRHLLLHEATHQFVCEAFGRRVDPLPPWLSEGLAELVAHHNWDGETLRIGLVDVVTVDGNNRLARCKALLEQNRLQVPAIVGSDGADRAPCWALAQVLHGDRAYRALLAAYIDRCLREPDGREPTAAQGAAWFEEVFGRKRDEVQKALGRFVAGERRSWRVVTVHWQQRGELIRGETDGRYALLASNRHTRCRARRIALTIGSDDWPSTTAGVAVGYRSPHDYHLVELVEGRLLHYVHVTRGLRRDQRVQRLGEPIAGGAALHMQLECREQEIRVTLRPHAVWRIRLRQALAEGGLALAVYRGAATFRMPTVTAAETRPREP